MSHNRELILAGYLGLGAAIYLWAIWPRRPKADLPPIPRFRTTVNDYCLHEFFRGVDFDAFARGCRASSFDRIDVDADLSRHVIAVVTVANWIGRPQFVTRFTTASGHEIVKEWPPTGKRLFGEAVGLFVLSDDVIGGRTEVRAAAERR